MTTDELKQFVLTQLDDSKASNVTELDVRNLTDLADYMVIATGTSGRHVRAMAQHLVTKLKEHDIQPIGVEGEDVGDWVLVDLSDIVVHLMQAEARDFYALEKLWQELPTRKDSVSEV